MARNKLGILARVPVAGQGKSRVSPTLSADAACDLYRAFLGDLFERVQQARVSPTIFYSGDPVAELSALLPHPWPLVPQSGDDLGARMANAFARLLADGASRAVLIGSDSPDIPLIHIRHAFQRLKHSDVVVGPAMDGGCYLIGLRTVTPVLLEHMAWGEATVFAKTVDAVKRAGLTMSVLPPWYAVDNAQSLALLRTLCAARRMAGGVRLPRTERVLIDR